MAITIFTHIRQWYENWFPVLYGKENEHSIRSYHSNRVRPFRYHSMPPSIHLGSVEHAIPERVYGFMGPWKSGDVMKTSIRGVSGLFRWLRITSTNRPESD